MRRGFSGRVHRQLGVFPTARTYAIRESEDSKLPIVLPGRTNSLTSVTPSVSPAPSRPLISTSSPAAAAARNQIAELRARRFSASTARMWESTSSPLPHDTVGEVDTGGIEGRGRDLVAAHPDVGFNHPWTGLTQNDLGVSGAELHTKGVEHPLHQILDLFLILGCEIRGGYIPELDEVRRIGELAGERDDLVLTACDPGR